MFTEIVNIVLAFAVVAFGTFLQRSITKRDKVREESEKAKEDRLVRMERTLNKHTRSLSALAKAQRISVETVSRHSEDIADLEDVTEQLQTSLEMHGRRITANEEYIQARRADRAARGIPEARMD